MHFPSFRVQDSNIAIERRSQLDGLESASALENTQGLEFPSLLDGKKRPRRNSLVFPAKRRKGMSPLGDYSTSEKEDNSWIDNFSLLDSFSPEEINFKSPSPDLLNTEETSVADIIKQALDVSAQDVISQPQGSTTHPTAQVYQQPITHVCNGHSRFQPVPATRVQKEQISPARVISQTEPFSSARQPAPTSPTVVSPFLNPVHSAPQQQVPPITVPQQVPRTVSLNVKNHAIGSSSEAVDSGVFSIARLKNSKEPTLLTLTSYPFRVVYSNGAFANLSGRKTSVIGDSVFDTFSIEGSLLRPCLSTYPTLAGRFENETVLVSTFAQDNSSSSIRCTIQSYPVTKRNDSNALRYFAIRLNRLDRDGIR